MIVNIEGNLIDINKIFSISPIKQINVDDCYFEINGSFVIELSSSDPVLGDYSTMGEGRKKMKELITKLRDQVIYHWNKDNNGGNSKIIELNFKSIQI